jgi:DNA-binding CsgD family transcriptional regulator
VVGESHLLCGVGEYERAASVARDGIADAERHGLARTRGAFLAINVAEPLLYLGRWDEAAAVAERALDLAPPPLTRVWLWILSGSIALARGTPADAADGPDRLGLTGREFKVLRLVAAGQSNRDIAAALFISPKTASVHVSNILGKLGAATRTEAAAKAHALRLFDDGPAAARAS